MQWAFTRSCRDKLLNMPIWFLSHRKSLKYPLPAKKAPLDPPLLSLLFPVLLQVWTSPFSSERPVVIVQLANIGEREGGTHTHWIITVWSSFQVKKGQSQKKCFNKGYRFKIEALNRCAIPVSNLGLKQGAVSLKCYIRCLFLCELNNLKSSNIVSKPMQKDLWLSFLVILSRYLWLLIIQ